MNQMVRSRQRIASTGDTSSQQNSRPRDTDTSWMQGGDERDAQEKQRRLQAEEQRAKNWNAPRRFWLKPGTQADVVILDHDIGARINEHKRWNARLNKEEFETCPGDWDSCPLCEQELAGFGRRTYHAFLTVVDLRPYTIQSGPNQGKTIQHQRKLIALKFDQLEKFKRLKQRNGGSLRGVHLLMVRGLDKKSFITGEPEQVMDDDNRGLKYDDDAILEAFGGPEKRDDKGNVIAVANADTMPFDYAKVFPKPSGDKLRDLYGGTPVPGSRRDNAANDDAPADDWGKHAPGQVETHAASAGDGEVAETKPKGKVMMKRRVTAQDDEAADGDVDNIPF